MMSSTAKYAVFAIFPVLIGFATVEAAAQDYDAPYIESGLGATNIEATAGNQELTVGVSGDGDLTVMSWPSPSFYDHMHYMTSNALDARLKPRFGAKESMGAFAAVAVKKEGSDAIETTFLRDDAWDGQVTYSDVDVKTIEATYEHEQWGLVVRQYDTVAEEQSVLARQYEVERQDDSDVEEAWIVGYANLSPNQTKVPQVPLADVLLVHRTDFIGLWDEAAESLVHFQPEDTGVVEEAPEAMGDIERDFGPLGELLEDEEVDTEQAQQLIEELDDHYAEGVYVTMAARPDSDQYQVGEDHTDTCAVLDEIADNIEAIDEEFPDVEPPADPAVVNLARCQTLDFDPVETVRQDEGWEYSAADAFEEASAGELSGDELAAGQVNTALRVPLEFDDDEAQAALLFAFGKSHQESVEQLNWARQQDLDELRFETEQAHREFVDQLWIPDEISGDLREFVMRTFLNIRVGTDGESGAVMASISRQPSYQLDWPRDGAFFNVALDIAGQHELVTRRMEFYADTIRDEAKDPELLLNEPVPGWPDNPSANQFPPDSWEMNYYADGTPGGPIRLEIDNTALLVWAYVYHVGHLEGPQRDDYIEDAWPVVERAANWLESWRDPKTGLNWPANEDDHIEYTQGLQGAATTFGALVDAARLAKEVGEYETAQRWLHRAGELRNAAMDEMYVEGEGFYNFPGQDDGTIGEGPPTWLGWPTQMLDDDDERLLEQVEEDIEFQLRRVRGEEGTGGYPTKAAMAAALVHDDEQVRQGALEVAKAYVQELSNPDTWTTGEAFMPVDDTGDGHTDRFKYGVATPHLWTSALVYLTLVSYHHPDRFDPHHEVLPDVEVPDVEPPEGTSDDVGMADAGGADVEDPDAESGCSCGVAPGGAGWMALFALLIWSGLRRVDAQRSRFG